MNYERDYNALVDYTASTGEPRLSRAGSTRSTFGMILRIDSLPKGTFPILTARKMFYKPVLGELAAFLKGATDIRTFKEFGCNYWDANASRWSANFGKPKEDWEVGQVYGAQWRNWRRQGYDQLKVLIYELRTNPFSRRHVLTTYDPEETYACLPPCHLMAQFNVTITGNLDCVVYMRSVDLCLGLPSDVVLYAALMLVICNEVDLKPGTLTFMLGDTHIYENHLDIWGHHGSLPVYPAPKFNLDKIATIDNFCPEFLDLLDYEHGDKLDYPFNV